MNYEQAMKHSCNHRKYKYFQQCASGIEYEPHTKSYATVAEETAESYYIFDEATQQKLTETVDDWDKIVDIYRELLPTHPQIAIYTDKGMTIGR